LTLGVCCEIARTMFGDCVCSISCELMMVTLAGTLAISTPVPASGVAAKTSIVGKESAADVAESRRAARPALARSQPNGKA